LQPSDLRRATSGSINEKGSGDDIKGNAPGRLALTSGLQCQLVYWDAMKPEKRAAAIASGGLPKSWISSETSFSPLMHRLLPGVFP
jgi:hypothetical protein